MNTGNRQLEFSIEEKLAELHLTPSQRAEAQGALKLANGLVDVVQFLTRAVKRLAEALSLKPSVRT